MKNKKIEKLSKDIAKFTGDNYEENVKYIKRALYLAYYQGRIDATKDNLKIWNTKK